MKSKLSTTKPDAELAAWCEALAQTALAPDLVPQGWKTIAQLSLETKTPAKTLQHKLKRLLEIGKAERKTFRVKLQKNVRPVPHYKLK